MLIESTADEVGLIRETDPRIWQCENREFALSGNGISGADARIYEQILADSQRDWTINSSVWRDVDPELG